MSFNENFTASQNPADVPAKASRKAFGEKLRDLGAEDEKIVVLDADLSKSTMSMMFAEKYPERFIEMGIQEANMLSTASGLALSGFTPFCCSFAAFISGRFDQIKMSVAYSEAKVRIVGTHAGIGIGPDGYSQQGLEDIAMMRALHKMVVLQPADDVETEQMVAFLAKDDAPAYLRLTRQNLPRVHGDDYVFELGKFPQLTNGKDLTLIATGGTVAGAMDAAHLLADKGISCRVLNASSLAPVDEAAIIAAAKETRGIVTIEDHNVKGGLGGAVCEVTAANAPCRVLCHGVKEFGESGTPEGLYAKHLLDGKGIAQVAEAFFKELT
ncbi:MAG: transketolase family protein [Deltaproteobacteria bacterium]|nr:transketolase family protein [Deltaproteobacteria bacterium]